ncbi:hypothetical protein BDA99DRAFT_512353 [Phascolomyces articulosus]|uniref:Uncharacterized protein n=1 Tax=Phascolomyces articulosus TaxID=60185 RepID=A0AAD5K8B6_9FUNG|nr:hypothetical protein BDA99DRAFT_512353 [Phascolomyces articulosus]
MMPLSSVAALTRGKVPNPLKTRHLTSGFRFLRYRFNSTAAMPVIEQEQTTFIPSNGATKALKQSNQFAISPYYNQGTGLSTEVRAHLGLRGYSPVAVESLDLQKERALKQLRSKSTTLDKYIFMAQLRNSNTRLFYKLVCDELSVSNYIFIFG